MIDPPLKIDLNKEVGASQVDTRFFNSKQSPQDLAETVLPQANLAKLKKNAKQFDNFDSKKQI